MEILRLVISLIFGKRLILLKRKMDIQLDYGDRAEHCWNGDQDNPNYISRLRYNSMYVPKIMKRILESAPKDADLTSWRYE